MKKNVFSAAVVLLLFFTLLPAQESVSKPTYSKADYKAAYELFAALEMSKLMEDAIVLMTNAQIKNAPMLEPVREPILNFFRKYMSYESMKKDYADIYLRNFTVPEIKALTAFYRTPLGKKLAQKQSILMQEGARIGEMRVQANLVELQTAIRDGLQKQKQ